MNKQVSRRVTFSTLLYKILGGNYHGKRNCKNTESYILVQVNEKGEEVVLDNDFRGQFYPTNNVNIATKFDDLDKVKALASRLNGLNELNYEFGIISEK